VPGPGSGDLHRSRDHERAKIEEALAAHPDDRRGDGNGADDGRQAILAQDDGCGDSVDAKRFLFQAGRKATGTRTLQFLSQRLERGDSVLRERYQALLICEREGLVFWEFGKPGLATGAGVECRTRADRVRNLELPWLY
jgi:hypothetical protein